MQSSPQRLRCLRCGAILELSDPEDNWVSCGACSARYPMVAGRIPILLDEPVLYLSRLYVQHNHYLRRLRARIEAIMTTARSTQRTQRTPERRASLERLGRAHEQNAALFSSFCDEIEPFISARDVVGAIHAPDFVGYTASLEYLERDWCFLPEAEAELSVLGCLVGERVSAHANPDATAVVLGAGTGRLAWDLTGVVREVYAIDASLVMVQQLDRVLRSEIVFSSIHTRSVARDEQMVLDRRARLLPTEADAMVIAERRERFHYVVADAARLPFPDASVGLIVSTYFTDVMPLPRLLDEVMRVLEPSGVFIHVGPFEYHFEEEEQHLSVECVKRTFEERGFCIASEESVTLGHLAREGIGAQRSFEIWAFAAVRKPSREEEPDVVLSKSTVLEVNQDVHFRIAGVLSSGGERTTGVELLLPSKQTFAGAQSVLDVLRFVDGKSNVGELVVRISEQFTSSQGGAEALVMRILQTLLQHGALRIR